MRKVTREAVAAFMNGESFKSGNTEVCVGGGGRDVALRLYSHTIALRTAASPDYITISTYGFNTTTTRERLNGLPGVDVNVSKGQLYLNDEAWSGGPVEVKIPE